jgi:hypothetical protein
MLFVDRIENLLGSCTDDHQEIIESLFSEGGDEPVYGRDAIYFKADLCGVATHPFSLPGG